MVLTQGVGTILLVKVVKIGMYQSRKTPSLKAVSLKICLKYYPFQNKRLTYFFRLRLTLHPEELHMVINCFTTRPSFNLYPTFLFQRFQYSFYL